MPQGFEYDPEAIRKFADVFGQAGAQMEQVRATVGDTSAKAADFGNSWGDLGAEFEEHMAAIVEDLGLLATHLTEIGGQLGQGADLMVQVDTSGLTSVKEIEDDLGSPR